MIRIITIGKVKEPYLKKGIEDFLTRLKPLHKVEILELKDKKTIELEGKDIIKRIKDDFVVVMDEFGQECRSRVLAEFIKKKCLEESGKIAFIIGSADGLSEDVKKRADLTIALSQMTFTHEMAQLFLLEQVYRGFSIIKGKKYHR
ncbi:23S rRNA (pseudouridine(1915)-N(3))-methyltransferase RlmH [Candidatus Woesearchaeota archaeon]|jgi:23S rRNA (pseudouridine1915-N3)-methyltransferase|nr:23S rRNA (pseudouridine(1915)-N(3))-methyltransferase RlmH [Candidatus Woesearchaeota archaeon]MBT5272420.1 23S rRNA (pseudouridine(1915)-N(3))-methyltransferase RlmH [Candidatus Woesearchaeota archaeon]MBT6041238.1 23S rRNA (pseudouridine(1915)-N(3))-methyltransferase RlmH [Candidatus Woesearchaeota archaeon]MBT6337474.1 23S rRNA (pseudouridine(1915)-N(3))-methyltransferase RlmH [Candidatus Woesearchaeota archaeon]MBT7928213.1 23S rRNA (pseudouridine(1915)-N(3))-methyltransferase RlmH [Cand